MCVVCVNKSNFLLSSKMSIGDDAVVVGGVKKSKKKKDKSAKKSATVEPFPAEAEQEGIEVDAPEKKKKRKREENGEGEERKKKRKKKKRKDTADGPSAEEPTPTAVEEKTEKQQAVLEIDKKIEQRKMKELRKQSKKQQKALAKPQAASSSRDSAATPKPAPTIKNIISTEEAEKYLLENSITIHGNVVPVLDFDQLDIQPALREVLNKFSKPTPIQACAWPALLEGKDVIGIAETGRFVPHIKFPTSHTEQISVAKPSHSAFRSSLALKEKIQNTRSTTYVFSSFLPLVNLQYKPMIRSWRPVPRSGYIVFASMEAYPRASKRRRSTGIRSLGLSSALRGG